MTVLTVMPGKKPTKMEMEGTLESMQEFVGGTIQAIYPFDDPVALICNDKGKLEGLEYNRALRNEKGAVYDIICGPFFACGLGEEEYVSLSEQLMETYFKRFEHPELFVMVGGNLVVMRFEIKRNPKHLSLGYSPVRRQKLMSQGLVFAF